MRTIVNWQVQNVSIIIVLENLELITQQLEIAYELTGTKELKEQLQTGKSKTEKIVFLTEKETN